MIPANNSKIRTSAGLESRLNVHFYRRESAMTQYATPPPPGLLCLHRLECNRETWRV